MKVRSYAYDGGKPEELCPVSGGCKLLPFWCEACQIAVAEKRCPLCGLKAKKIRPGGSEADRRG